MQAVEYTCLTLLSSCPPSRGLFIQAADNHPHKPRSYHVGRPFPTTNTAPRFFGGGMAKRMNDDHKIVGLSWLILLGIACWGGLVRYLIDVKQNKATWSWINAFAQIAVSGFTGLIGGLISVEGGLSFHMILVTSGISGAMGSVALTYFWERLTGMKNANQ
ncbi:holin [Salmonella phage Salfasec13b]|nr:holin [Salmonella phage Salfasec13b]